MISDTKKSDFAAINGAEIYYTITGINNPETMLMIHAGICDSRMWQAQVEHFQQKYKVITLDMRGFGKSKMVSGKFSHYGDVLSLLDFLKVEHTWLMACSMGGRIALDIALTKPDLVKGLLLVAPAINGYRYTGEPHPLESAFDEAEENNDLARLCELEMQVWVDGKGRNPTDVEATMRQLVYDMNFIPLNVTDELWEQEEQPETDAINRLNEIDKPTLLIAGDLDPASSLERVAIIEKQIAGVKSITMTGTAHLPNMEYPALFNQHVDDFLANI